MVRKLSILLLLLACPMLLVLGQNTYSIPFKRGNGGLIYIQLSINGSNEEFIYDTGASGITLNLSTYQKLKSKGLISDADLLGITQAMMANGAIANCYEVMLRTVQLGGFVVKNIPALIMPDANAALLLGQSVISKFGKVSIDYVAQTITFEYNGNKGSGSAGNTGLNEIRIVPCEVSLMADAAVLNANLKTNNLAPKITQETNVPPPPKALDNVRAGVTVRYFDNNDFVNAQNIKQLLETTYGLNAGMVNLENMLPYFSFNAMPGYIEIWLK